MTPFLRRHYAFTPPLLITPIAAISADITFSYATLIDLLQIARHADYAATPIAQAAGYSRYCCHDTEIAGH
jgi:hypothetical protein